MRRYAGCISISSATWRYRPTTAGVGPSRCDTATCVRSAPASASWTGEVCCSRAATSHVTTGGCRSAACERPIGRRWARPPPTACRSRLPRAPAPTPRSNAAAVSSTAISRSTEVIQKGKGSPDSNKFHYTDPTGPGSPTKSADFVGSV